VFYESRSDGACPVVGHVDQPCLGGMMQQQSLPSQSRVVVRGVCDCEDTGPCESEPC